MESHEDLCLEVIRKTLVMRKYSHKKWSKNFSGKFGEIRAKILCSPENFPALTPMSEVFGLGSKGQGFVIKVDFRFTLSFLVFEMEDY